MRLRDLGLRRRKPEWECQIEIKETCFFYFLLAPLAQMRCLDEEKMCVPVSLLLCLIGGLLVAFFLPRKCSYIVDKNMP